MQSEAFRVEKSFAHGPKPSKHSFYTLVYDSNVKANSNKCQKQILTGATPRKKCAEFYFKVRFA